MRGIIIDGDDGILIAGSDKKQYLFTEEDWKGAKWPSVNNWVDFEIVEGQAKNVYPMLLPNEFSVAKLAALCTFFGIFGVHRFIVGKFGTGLVMLICTLTLLGLVVSVVWSIIDVYFILSGAFKNEKGVPIRRRQAISA